MPTTPQVTFELDNVRVRIREAPDFALRALRDRLAYLSPAAQDAGMEAPAMSQGLDAPEYHWDGMVRFLRIPKPRMDGTSAEPWFETGLLARAMGVLGELGVAVRVFDFRRRPDSNEDVPPFWPSASEPAYDYQEAAVRAAEAAGRGVIVAPPRSGKTRLLLELLRRLNQPALFVVPTTTLEDQTRRAALAYGFSDPDVVVLSDKPDWARVRHSRLWIATAARVLYLDPVQAETRAVIVCDELHHFTKGGGWGRALHKLFPHVYHWYGATGTYFRSSGDDMSLEAFLSGVVFSVSSAELLARGRLVPTRLAYVPVEGLRLQRGGDARRDLVLLSDERNALVAAAAIHLANKGRRVLVMVALKEQGRRIAEIVNSHAPPARSPEWKFAEFLFRGRGGPPDRDSKFRARLTRAFLEGDGPSVLLGTSLLGEGVDLPDADAVIWARGEHAAVSYLQGLYRVCTARPGKVEALALDFADRSHPSLLRASLERLEIALSDPVFQVRVLESPEQIATWAEGQVK